MSTQEIIVYIIIAAALVIFIRSLVRTLRPRTAVGKSCHSCSPGTGCEGCALKELMDKKQK